MGEREISDSGQIRATHGPVSDQSNRTTMGNESPKLIQLYGNH